MRVDVDSALIVATLGSGGSLSGSRRTFDAVGVVGRVVSIWLWVSSLLCSLGAEGDGERGVEGGTAEMGGGAGEGSIEVFRRDLGLYMFVNLVIRVI